MKLVYMITGNGSGVAHYHFKLLVYYNMPICVQLFLVTVVQVFSNCCLRPQLTYFEGKENFALSQLNAQTMKTIQGLKFLFCIPFQMMCNRDFLTSV